MNSNAHWKDRQYKSVIIEDGITAMGSYAFYSSSLSNIIIPDSVISIGQGAFYCCSNLSTIVIPEGITVINADTFRECGNLKDIKLPVSFGSIGKQAFSGSLNLKSVIIPEGVKTISMEAFQMCMGLTSITIPKSVTDMDMWAFLRCDNLQELVMKSDAPNILGGGSLAAGPDPFVVKVPKGAAGYGAYPWNECKIVYIESGPDKPLPVSNLKAAADGRNRTRLSWNASSNAEGYLIYAQKKGKYGYCGVTSGLSFIDKKASKKEYNFY
ncbi:leucine-rich repeat domain-containing protein [Clostridium sp. AF19-22AC]|jgi:hypothetical protein|uniref:leucine-rich repeat domain-containing protein n=1 Tax=Clostridia TaxID=186801 RepID=UPI000E468D48|nr:MULTISPECIES: leucine-rich repeat domain-containing protein [Clostridia]RHR20537.1 leucine-rich repeat domain-containing protein [Clostridium sp. AF19-22AC]